LIFFLQKITAFVTKCLTAGSESVDCYKSPVFITTQASHLLETQGLFGTRHLLEVIQ